MILETLGILLVFVGGFIVGSLFPQPEFIKIKWDIVVNYFKNKFKRY